MVNSLRFAIVSEQTCVGNNLSLYVAVLSGVHDIGDSDSFLKYDYYLFVY